MIEKYFLSHGLDLEKEKYAYKTFYEHWILLVLFINNKTKRKNTELFNKFKLFYAKIYTMTTLIFNLAFYVLWK